jgi:hypothetical protein
MNFVAQGIAVSVEPLTQASATERLAEILVDKAMITPARRDWAIARHAQTGRTLTIILVSTGMVSRGDLYRVLASDSVISHPVILAWPAPRRDLPVSCPFCPSSAVHFSP